MAGVAKAASGALGPNRRWLPMLPSPFLDETFGSWWHRAANAYQTTEWDLADAILGRDNQVTQLVLAKRRMRHERL